MNTVSDGWKEFSEKVLGRNIPAGDLLYLSSVFYAGSFWVLKVLGTQSAEARNEMLKSMREECSNLMDATIEEGLNAVKGSLIWVLS